MANVYLVNNLPNASFFAGDKFDNTTNEYARAVALGGIFVAESPAVLAMVARCNELRSDGDDPILRELLMNNLRPVTSSLLPRRTEPDQFVVCGWKLNSDLPHAGFGQDASSISNVSGYQTINNTAMGKVLRISPGTCQSPLPSMMPSKLSVHCWVFLESYVTQTKFVVKNYRANDSWSAPFSAFELGFDASNVDGRWSGAITIAGVQTRITTNPNVFKIGLGEATHVAMTYEGSQIKLYQNGLLAASQSIAGDIDYGTNGRYIIGGAPGGIYNVDGWISDVQVDAIARSREYFESIYLARMGY